MKDFKKTSSKLQKRQHQIHQLKSLWLLKLQRNQNTRLLLGLLFFSSLILIASVPDTPLLFAGSGLLLGAFIFFVIRTRQIAIFYRKLERFGDFFTRQQQRCLGLPSGKESPQFEIVRDRYEVLPDIGILGEHSLWTLLDETLSSQGKNSLLQWICTPPLAREVLQKRQELIQNLRSLRWFYTRLILNTDTQNLNHASHQVLDILKRPFTTPSFKKVLNLNVALWTTTVLLVILQSAMDVQVPLILFLIFPLVSWVSLGQVATVFNAGTGLSIHFLALSEVFAQIETRQKYSSELRAVLPEIAKSQPSRDSKKLETFLGLLGTQTNPLLHLLLNALLPWTYVSVFLLERHRRKIELYFPEVYTEMGEFEVLGSLIIFDHYQTNTYPHLHDSAELRFKNLLHPLLKREQAVANSFALTSEKSLGLLTGSNMSGKSTFLRTVGLNQVLANMGAPVFADDMHTRSFKIETCIEVSDSLRDGHSYFYAEVRKLKGIIDYAKTHQPLLFLIDEIFRGTNNKERQIGSRGIIRALANEPSAIGLISTHDLDLTKITETQIRVTNLHFKESITSDGKMHFTYQLNEGPCPTTNALIIMESEGIYFEDP